MRPLLRLLALLAASLLVLTACGDDDTNGDAATTTTETTIAGAGADTDSEDDPGGDNTTPSRGRIELTATLTGEAQVPGPGDDDASGEAHVTVDVANNEVCVEYRSIEGLGEVVAAHIHRGGADASGPIVVTLAAPGDGADEEARCHRDADRDVVTAIAGNPSGFYVNVHTDEFPAGAIRGQLEQAS